MTNNEPLDLATIEQFFEGNDIFANPSEVHGMLTGLLCGGAKLAGIDYVGPTSDFFNQGLTFPAEILVVLETLFKDVWGSLVDPNLSFTPLIPDDEELLSVRSSALADWTQGFLLGFGINKQVLSEASDDINEVIRDFSEISQMTVDLDDTEENETALNEVLEYLRISVNMCFGELGDNPLAAKNKITLH